MQRAAELDRAVRLGERERHVVRGEMHVALVRPRALQRAAAERQPFEIADDGPRRGREVANRARHRGRGIHRHDRPAEMGAVPSRSAAEVGAHTGRSDPGRELGGRGRQRPVAVLDPVGSVVLVDVDGLAVQDREEWHRRYSRFPVRCVGYAKNGNPSTRYVATES